MFHVEQKTAAFSVFHVERIQWICFDVPRGTLEDGRIRKNSELKQGRALYLRVGAGICGRSGGELLKNYDAPRV